MQHASLSTLPCPIARGLDRVGDWWNIMILRDAFHGITRFDQFQKSLGIAPNILSRRLRGLVERGKGILQRELGLSEHEAYLALQRQSQQKKRPMKEIAQAIILSAEVRQSVGQD